MKHSTAVQPAPLRFQPVIASDGIAAVARLAHTIWHAHFGPIIGRPQVVYMLERFQSARAIRSQLQEGFRYWLLRHGTVDAGYIAVRADAPTGSLLVSKVYVAADYRRLGLARQSFAFMRQLARREDLRSLVLTVNRHNAAAIAAYQRMGLRITGSQVQDIGGGFVMDDYRMELRLE